MNTLIVGATGGLGQALAEALAGRASPLWLSGRNGQILAGMAQLYQGQAVPADLANELELKALCEEVGSLDLLIYAAGAVSKASLRDTRSSELERQLIANQNGLAGLLKYARFNPAARVVLLGVYPELVTVAGLGAYAASKLGAEALLSVARKELRREGVRCTLVRLPAVATPLWSPLGGPPKTALAPQQAAGRLLEAALSEPPPEVVEI